MNTLLDTSKRLYYTNMVQEASNDSKSFFKVVEKLLCRKKETSLSDCKSTAELAAEFGKFFIQKVQTIHASLGGEADASLADVQSAPNNCSLDEFQCATQEEVRKLIMASPTKSCSLDPVPTWLLKKCSASVVPILTDLVNLSLLNGSVPDQLKVAHAPY